MYRLFAAVVASLFILGSASADYSSRYLEVSNFKDEVDEYGLVVFTGEVKNIHTTRIISVVNIYVTLKKDGVIIGITRIFTEELEPLASTSFEYETLYAKEEYDELSVRPSGVLEDGVIDDLVVGEAYIVEESFNVVYNFQLVTWSDIVADAIFGEIRNETNAIISGLKVSIEFFDARGNTLGGFTTDKLDTPYREEISPGETISFTFTFKPGVLPAEGKIKSWKVRLAGWTAIEIVDNAIATSVESVSWGAIKAMER